MEMYEALKVLMLSDPLVIVFVAIFAFTLGLIAGVYTTSDDNLDDRSRT